MHGLLHGEMVLSAKTTRGALHLKYPNCVLMKMLVTAGCDPTPLLKQMSSVHS